MEINHRYNFLYEKQKILELGCNPGAITQFLVENTLSDFRAPNIVSVDKETMEKVPGSKFIQGNFVNNKILTEIINYFEYQNVDLIVSNLTPKLQGDLDRDQINMMMLNIQTLFISTKLLEKGGNMIIKTLHGYHEIDIFVKDSKFMKKIIFL